MTADPFPLIREVSCRIVNSGGDNVTVYASTLILGAGCAPGQQTLQNDHIGSVSCTSGPIDGPGCTVRILNAGATDAVASMYLSESGPQFSIVQEGYPLSFVLDSLPPSGPINVTIAAFG